LALSVPLSRFTPRVGGGSAFFVGGYTFMKNTHLILLSAILLFGCSKKQAISAPQATDRIEAGKDIVLGGSVVHVTKRDGDSIEGVRIVTKYAGGIVKTLIADTGRVRQGSNTLAIILDKAECLTKTESGTTTNIIQSQGMVFYLSP
jgi:uncharacterized lipoprotein YajG